MQRREIVRSAAYHSHPHWQRTEWLRWRFSISFLHTAHNLVHITLLPIRRISSAEGPLPEGLFCYSFDQLSKNSGRVGLHSIAMGSLPSV